jgi:hypothetical protein
MGQPGQGDEPAWRLLRGYCSHSDSTGRHQGADLGDGRAGDPVHAAAHGLVVLTRDQRDEGGFGCLVVLAHRLGDGGVAYSVYAHLRRGSVQVREGQLVRAGETLGEVGRTGNATADHLHFEIRLASDPTVRWERTSSVDPLRFVERRLPAHAADTSCAGPYLDWAERAGLLERGAQATEALSRGAWQRMLSRAARLPLLKLPHGPSALRGCLIEQGVLPAREHGSRGRTARWEDLERDVARLAGLGTCLPPGPAGGPGPAPPAPERARRRPDDGPTVADACRMLAGLTHPEVSEPGIAPRP